MKKILWIVPTMIIVLFMTGIFILNNYYNLTTEKQIKDLMIINVKFKNLSEIYPNKLISVNLYSDKNNRKIEPIIKNNLIFFDKVFSVPNGNYTIEIEYENQKIKKSIIKNQNIEKVEITLEPEAYIKNISTISRLFSFFIFFINFFIFLKYRKSMKLIFCITFFVLLINNAIDLVIFQNQNILNYAHLLIDVFILLILGFYFYFKSNHIVLKIITSIYLITIILSSTLIPIINSVFSFKYLFSYNSFFINFITISVFYVNLFLLINFTSIIINKFRHNTNIVFKKILLFFILTVIFMSVLNLFSAIVSMPVHMKNTPIKTFEIFLFFWVLFFTSDIELLFILQKKYNNIIFYIFKTTILLHISYILSIYFKNIYFFSSVILMTILFDVMHFYVYRNINKHSFFKEITKKLKGIEDINIFEKILENEILKDFPIKNIKFKILYNDNEKNKYFKKGIENRIVFKDSFECKYKNFDFAILQRNEKNLCTALLLIELQDRILMKEIAFILADLLDKLFYISNYIRILNLKKALEKDNYESKNITNEEKIMFIKKFISLINMHTTDNRIKSYTKYIHEAVEELEERNV